MPNPSSDEQRSEANTPYSTYGTFTDNPTPEQLETYFTLTPADRALIRGTRYPHTQLGLGVQLCTLKFLGTFLADPSDVPETAVRYIADQLGIANIDLGEYATNEDSRLRHQARIRAHLGYREFDTVAQFGVCRLLLSRLALADEHAVALFDAVTAQLVERRIELPGASTIQKIIARAREHASKILYRQLASRLSPAQLKRLESLLLVPKGDTRTRLDRLRAEPTSLSSVGLAKALERVRAVREIGVGSVSLEDVADNRLAPLIRSGLSLWPSTLQNYGEFRRRSILLALVQYLERSATDDALTVFDRVMRELDVRGRKRRAQERLRTLKDLDSAALTLRDVARVVLDSKIPARLVRETVLQKLGEAKLLEAVSLVSNLASPAENEEVEVWDRAHSTLAQFIRPLLETIRFESSSTGQATLEALAFLKRTTGTPRSEWGAPPQAFVPKVWRSRVFPDGVNGDFSRSRYTVCAVLQLHTGLARGDIFVVDSNAHRDPRAHLLEGEAWEKGKPDVLRSLNLPAKPKDVISRLSRALHAKYKDVQRQLKSNPLLELREENGVLVPHHRPLEALPEPESLVSLDREVSARLPEIDLAEILLEMNARTGFLDEMLRGADARLLAADLATSLAAVLLAETCNIGLKAVSRETDPALRGARLEWVKKTYLDKHAITRGNARLVDFHANLPLTRRWGNGEVASSDGLRFVVPVKSIHSGFNRKYFGAKRGITYYTLISDQFTQLHGQVIPGTIRDSLYILAGLLEQATSLKPVEIMSDTAGYSDVVFGLFHLLGFRFSPRLADVGRLRYWRISREANYGPLEGVSKNRVNMARIADYWEDILRLVGSLKLGKVKAPDVMRVLARDGALNGLGKAVGEVGRVAKTLYLLDFFTDESYRRRVQTQLNRGETRGGMARHFRHGEGGVMRQRYKVGMEAQLGALGLVLNAALIWNTLYAQAALELLGAMGHQILEEDVARLSPLKWAHVNVLGRFEFTMSPEVAGGDLRALRDPNALSAIEVLDHFVLVPA